MKFRKEDLQQMLYSGVDDFEILEDELISHSRWSLIYRLVFKYQDKYYMTRYTNGATEYQDERPFEYEPDYIWCDEVEPYEKTIIDYKKI